VTAAPNYRVGDVITFSNAEQARVIAIEPNDEPDLVNRLLFSNWRLTLIQVLPAMWIWLAILDLKAHVFKGNEFHVWHGSVQAVLVVAITLVTAAGFYLNAVFAFAIARPGPPQIRPAFTLARRHLGIVLSTGAVVGAALGISAIVVPRWGLSWFALALGIVIGVMMLTYVTIPARLVGIKPTGIQRQDGGGRDRRDAWRDRLYPALRARAPRDSAARIECLPVRARRHPPRVRTHPASWRDRRRQSDQDEREAGRRQPHPRPKRIAKRAPRPVGRHGTDRIQHLSGVHGPLAGAPG
jgi:hypothetical protein